MLKISENIHLTQTIEQCGHKDQSFLAFWYKSKQDTVCQIHCRIHCRIQYDIVENVFSDKFGYSKQGADMFLAVFLLPKKKDLIYGIIFTNKTY